MILAASLYLEKIQRLHKMKVSQGDAATLELYSCLHSLTLITLVKSQHNVNGKVQLLYRMKELLNQRAPVSG